MHARIHVDLIREFGRSKRAAKDVHTANRHIRSMPPRRKFDFQDGCRRTSIFACMTTTELGLATLGGGSEKGSRGGVVVVVVITHHGTVLFKQSTGPFVRFDTHLLDN